MIDFLFYSESALNGNLIQGDYNFDNYSDGDSFLEIADSTLNMVLELDSAMVEFLKRQTTKVFSANSWLIAVPVLTTSR